MSERAAGLAAAFERANGELIQALKACSEDQLKLVCESEGWPVTVAAHHVASSTGPLTRLITLMANGQPLPAISMDMINAGNAQHAEEFANVGRQETLDLLRQESDAAANLIRGFTDEQLDRTAPMAFAGGAPWSTADLIERILIAHPTQHAQSIRAITAA
jgi:hypothetical protein